MIAIALACFLAGLMVGLVIGSPSGLPANRRVHGDAHGAVPIKPPHPKSSLVDAAPSPKSTVQPFRLRRSFKERRAEWEKKHNTKAQQNASIREQIRKAQEGTLT